MTTKTTRTKKADAVTQAYAGDITKFDDTPDGLMVTGIASSPRVDLDEQIADPTWLKSAMPDWYQWANVRGMHGSVAAGVGKELAHGDGDKWGLKALVVDDDSAKKVRTGVYKGFSIGIKGAKVIRDAVAKGGRIVGGTIVEVSLVDRPCNPDAVLSIAKAEGAALAPVDGAGVVLAKFDEPDAPEVVQPAEEAAPADDADQMLADAAKTVKTTVVVDGAAVADAVKSAKSKAKKTPKPVERTITPSAYRKALATVAGVLAGDIVKRKADESADIAGAQQVLSQLAQLIISEATELAAGRMEEANDISCLMDAVRAVKYFICCEMEQDGTEVGSSGSGDTSMSYVQLSAQAEAEKSATVTGEDKATADTLEVTELVKAAVTEANRASEGRIQALEAELAKVLAQPIPGGPMILPTAGTGAPAQPSPNQLLAKRYTLMAEQAGNPDVARAYRALAEVHATT